LKTSPGVLPHRMSHIDAIRAVAVLFVMWTHYAEKLAPLAGSGQWLNTLQQYGNFGRIGVVAFFALSGLLIPKSLTGPLGEGTRRFLIRRFFRLYPAFWLSIPLGFVTYWFLFDKPMDTAGWLANATMLPDALGHPEMMGHYWTLETELVFYLLCLGLFWQGGIQRMRDLSLTCAGLGLAFVVTSALHMIPESALGQYKGMLYHLSIMFWGACFRKAYDNPNERVVFQAPVLRMLRVEGSYKQILFILTAEIVVISILTGVVAFKQHDSQHVINSVSYVLGLIVFTVLATVWKIHLRFFAWLGEISYSMYLLHGVPLYVLFWLCSREGWVGGPLALYMLIAGVFAVGLSWLSFRIAEAPAIQFAHALTSTRRMAVSSPVRVGDSAPEKNGS
jgi:peptidoglycan/LPS O-acetylase OafA/YrhL